MERNCSVRWRYTRRASPVRVRQVDARTQVAACAHGTAEPECIYRCALRGHVCPLWSLCAGSRPSRPAGVPGRPAARFTPNANIDGLSYLRVYATVYSSSLVTCVSPPVLQLIVKRRAGGHGTSLKKVTCARIRHLSLLHSDFFAGSGKKEK